MLFLIYRYSYVNLLLTQVGYMSKDAETRFVCLFTIPNRQQV